MWAWELNFELTIEEWKRQFRYVYSLTMSTKLRFFQYRLIQRKIVTNMMHHKWNSSVNPLCSFRRKELETQKHIFCDCEIVKKLWKSLSQWLKYMFNITVELNPVMILYNNYNGLHKEMINCFILISKQYIYSMKCMDKMPIFITMLSKVYEIQNIEKTIAMRQHRYNKYYRKWCALVEV